MLLGWPGAQGHNILSTVMPLGSQPPREPSTRRSQGAGPDGAFEKENSLRSQLQEQIRTLRRHHNVNYGPQGLPIKRETLDQQARWASLHYVMSLFSRVKYISTISNISQELLKFSFPAYLCSQVMVARYAFLMES